MPVAARIFASRPAIVGSSVDVWPLLRRELEQVHLLDRAADRVLEDPLLRQRAQDDSRARVAQRKAELLDVEEEERLPAAVEDARDHDRPALAHAVLVEDDVVLRQVVRMLK